MRQRACKVAKTAFSRFSIKVKSKPKNKSPNNKKWKKRKLTTMTESAR